MGGWGLQSLVVTMVALVLGSRHRLQPPTRALGKSAALQLLARKRFPRISPFVDQRTAALEQVSLCLHLGAHWVSCFWNTRYLPCVHGKHSLANQWHMIQLHLDSLRLALQLDLLCSKICNLILKLRWRECQAYTRSRP